MALANSLIDQQIPGKLSAFVSVPSFCRPSHKRSFSTPLAGNSTFISSVHSAESLLGSQFLPSRRRALRVCRTTATSAGHATCAAGNHRAAKHYRTLNEWYFHQDSVRVRRIEFLFANIFRNLLAASAALVLSSLYAIWIHRTAGDTTTNTSAYYELPSGIPVSSQWNRKASFATVYPFVSSHRIACGLVDSHIPTRGPHLIKPTLAHVAPRLGSDSIEKQPIQKSLLGLACVMFTLAAALAAAETAITTLWPWKVRELAEKEGEKSPFALLESDLTRFLTTILVSTTSATIFSTAIATELAGEMLGSAGVGYVTAGMTVFFLFFGEILPKALAVHAPAKVARFMVPFISTLSIIVYPVGKLLAAISTFILRRLKLPFENDTTVSEEELRLIVAGADRSGSIEKYESQIIHNVLDLEETDVKSVMCPRVDMVALPSNNTLAQLLELESECHYSRMPVYDSTIDNIVGVALAKSLLRYLNEDPEKLKTTKVSEVMDPAFFIPDSMSVWVALEEMRKRRLHMAVVVDEYGGTAGLVTLEDVLEEVVGEIYDEDDDYEAETQFISKIRDNLYNIDGQASLEKVAEAFNLILSEDDLDDYGTISGFLCAQMGGIPQAGEELVVSHVRFRVSDATDRRIVKLQAEILTVEEVSRIEEEEQRMKANEAKADGQELSRSVLDIEPVPKKHKHSDIQGNGVSQEGGPAKDIEEATPTEHTDR